MKQHISYVSDKKYVPLFEKMDYGLGDYDILPDLASHFIIPIIFLYRCARSGF